MYYLHTNTIKTIDKIECMRKIINISGIREMGDRNERKFFNWCSIMEIPWRMNGYDLETIDVDAKYINTILQYWPEVRVIETI
jgi:hypothetical protein